MLICYKQGLLDRVLSHSVFYLSSKRRSCHVNEFQLTRGDLRLATRYCLAILLCIACPRKNESRSTVYKGAITKYSKVYSIS